MVARQVTRKSKFRIAIVVLRRRRLVEAGDMVRQKHSLQPPRRRFADGAFDESNVALELGSDVGRSEAGARGSVDEVEVVQVGGQKLFLVWRDVGLRAGQRNLASIFKDYFKCDCFRLFHGFAGQAGCT